MPYRLHKLTFEVYSRIPVQVTTTHNLLISLSMSQVVYR